jgi:hypothetical protein
MFCERSAALLRVGFKWVDSRFIFFFFFYLFGFVRPYTDTSKDAVVWRHALSVVILRNFKYSITKF